MRLLVLVLSCRKPPYDALWEAQQRTWDSVSVPDVSTLYYWCDELATMPWRLKLALDSAWDARWDMIFRTNSSSYVDKARLLAKAKTLPTERIAFSKQLDLLRAYVAAAGPAGKPANNNEVATRDDRARLQHVADRGCRPVSRQRPRRHEGIRRVAARPDHGVLRRDRPGARGEGRGGNGGVRVANA